MKILFLDKGEAGYIAIPEGSQISVEETKTRQNGCRLILVRVT